MSDHIVYAGDDCFGHILRLFNAITGQGVVVDDFRESVVVPVPKGRNVNTSNSSYYRGIALSSLFGNISFDNFLIVSKFDNTVLERYHSNLASSELQFAFKPRNSTNLCSMVL